MRRTCWNPPGIDRLDAYRRPSQRPPGSSGAEEKAVMDISTYLSLVDRPTAAPDQPGNGTVPVKPLTIALVAHDQKKASLAAWAARHREQLAPHQVVCTATTSRVI